MKRTSERQYAASRTSFRHIEWEKANREGTRSKLLMYRKLYGEGKDSYEEMRLTSWTTNLKTAKILQH